MKKADLLKLIEALPDGADVRLWNGMVGDWMDIDNIAPSTVVRMSLKCYLNLCRMETCQERKDWDYQLSAEEIANLTKQHRKQNWEFNQYVTQERIDDGSYLEKTIHLINAKLRGETQFDRSGSYSY